MKPMRKRCSEKEMEATWRAFWITRVCYLTATLPELLLFGKSGSQRKSPALPPAASCLVFFLSCQGKPFSVKAPVLWIGLPFWRSSWTFYLTVFVLWNVTRPFILFSAFEVTSSIDPSYCMAHLSSLLPLLSLPHEVFEILWLCSIYIFALKFSVDYPSCGFRRC